MIVSNVQAAEAVQTASRSTQAAAPDTSATSEIGKNYYFSPALILDPKSQAVVFEFRNAQTGAVTAEYPSHPAEKAVAAYTQQSSQTSVATVPPVQQKTSDVTTSNASNNTAASSGVDSSAQKVSTAASILA